MNMESWSLGARGSIKGSITIMHIDRPMRILGRKKVHNTKTTAESYVFAEDSSQELEARKGQTSDGPRRKAIVNPNES